MTGVQTCALPICFPVTIGFGSFVSSSNSRKSQISQSYLGLSSVEDADNPLVYSKDQTVNLLPLAAYQKIYYDSFSNSQWEKHLAYAYNVDYWTGDSPITLATDMLKLRYANYPKDYFMGILPSSQYGSVAALPISTLSNFSNTSIVAPSSQGVLVNTSGASVARSAYVVADLSALSIRATEYL